MARFAVAQCPECAARFRLRWQIGGRRLAVSAVVRLACPACGHSFEQELVRVTVFSAGRESFPLSSVVTLADLVRVA